MKTSIEWLKEYADINVSATELGDILTMTGSKVETIEELGADIQNVVVGKIETIEKHPDADKLVVTKVNVGTESIQIVTGAKNIQVGDIIPVAKNGAKLPGGVEIKTGKLRGIESCGMMCSIGELNLSKEQYPDQIEDGIMILPKEYENKLGEDITEVLKLRETIIDFEITSNRPDCFSIEGLGRETALSLGQKFINPRANLDTMQVEDRKELEGLKVDIEAPDLCYRYIARAVKNVKIGPSPEWMVRRLHACGVRSINNIVDITNYVMLELGQPMHAFDIHSIEGKHIIVRRAKPGETITTLDEQERNLNENMLVIADEKKAVAIAGVMGGLNSEIETNTQTVVFESAVFYGGSVRKTAKAVGLRTEASSRYEKGLSPENALRAVNRAVELVELLQAGEVIEGKVDVYPTKQKEVRIPLEPKRINDLLGLEVPEENMINIFEMLGMKVENKEVIPPYYRPDIEQMADLAEEVLRFYGYDKLGSTLIKAEGTVGGKNKQQKIEDTIRDTLVTLGLSEIYTYGFISEKDFEKIGISPEDILKKQSIQVMNPLSEEYTTMRTTTISEMMKMLANNNNKKNQIVKLFDISRIYRNDKGQIEKGELPSEENYLTIGMYGNADFYTLKGIVENVLTKVGVERYDVIKETQNKTFHPGRTANLKVGTDIFATLGEIHPLVQENYDIGTRVYIATINLDKVTKYARTNKKYEPIPKFPAVERDIAMLLDEQVEVGKIEKILKKKAKKGLESYTLFDVYQNEKLGANKKSVAYALKFRDKNKTLTDEEIQHVMQDIIADLENTLGAELRK